MNTVILRQAISTLDAEFGVEVTALAAMVYTTTRLLQCACKKHGIDPASMVHTLERCVESHCIDRDIHPDMLMQVVRQLDHDLCIAAE